MRVIVCGSRDWTDRDAIENAIASATWMAIDDGEVVEIVHGAARGADLYAQEWALKNNDRGVVNEPHPADWNRLGKRAGFVRNSDMAGLGADLCIAFWDGESRGTLDMITRAVQSGILVDIVPMNAKKE